MLEVVLQAIFWLGAILTWRNGILTTYVVEVAGAVSSLQFTQVDKAIQ